MSRRRVNGAAGEPQQFAAMRLERRRTHAGDIRWLILDGTAGASMLPADASLGEVLRDGLPPVLSDADGIDWTLPALAPVDAHTEVWAAGVTYRRSLHARKDESATPDIYDRVYDAARPELFYKSTGWRVRGPHQSIVVRADSAWNVPEPELAVVIDPAGRIVGATICNDVSSRTIEGDNPLYLPQAKTYLGSCALGPSIALIDDPADLYDRSITLVVDRGGATIWSGSASTGELHRRIEELAEYLFRADIFPYGVVLSTGTSVVPGPEFTLTAGDVVRIAISGLGELTNTVVNGIELLANEPGMKDAFAPAVPFRHDL